MDRFIHSFKACVKANDSEEKPRTRLRPYTTDYTANPHSRFAVSLFHSLLDASCAPDTNVSVCPRAVHVLLAAMLPASGAPPSSPSSWRPIQLQTSPEGGERDDTWATVPALRRVTYNTSATLSAVAFIDDNASLPEQRRLDTLQYVRVPFRADPPKALRIISQLAGSGEPIFTAADRSLIIVQFCRFNGVWEHPFSRYTTPATFYCADGEEKTVDMMDHKYTCLRVYNLHQHYCDVIEDGDPHMVILNIDRRLFSVMILLPTARSGGTATLEAGLTLEKLLAWRQKSKDQSVRIVLPKFRISCTVDLQPCLLSRGLGGLFASAPDVDPSGCMHADEILQHIPLDMSEYGMSTPPFEWVHVEYSMVDSDPDFVANRPFLLIIWDEVANVPLILSRVTDPTVSSRCAAS
ncbi:serpin I2-like [Paramacrobiotus metropolitanus]|uniref:serpin I2-like n=1 Tax=Paramacrobiotus metropolitanus TaxID=2943436 RepID=UPI0024457998|nr:serpin I2-like [Paramacrobiotus metropolitanus]